MGTTIGNPTHECGIDCTRLTDGRHLMFSDNPTARGGWDSSLGRMSSRVTRREYRASGQDETRNVRAWNYARSMWTRGAYDITEIDPTLPRAIVCGHCGRAWGMDITPAGRCPWEHMHDGGILAIRAEFRATGAYDCGAWSVTA